MKANESDWELCPEPPYGYPDLESVIDHAKQDGYMTPRKRPDESLNISVRNMPADIWDMVFFIKEDHPSVGTMSMAEGCLIRCGLRVVEDILKASPRNKMKRRGAIQANDTDTRYEYLSRCYSMVHLGAASVRAVVVFTLDEQDRARLMELANTYGLANSTMTIVAMTAGVAQSTVVVPKAFRERAVSEISRFKKWLTGY